MMKLPFFLVDAFTSRPFAGNPAAVVPLEAPLPVGVMQAMAAEHNLSETAFVMRKGTGWLLRWFTPMAEVELCGHATLATAFVLARELNLVPPFTFQTLSGPLVVEADGPRFILDFPARLSEPATPPWPHFRVPNA